VSKKLWLSVAVVLCFGLPLCAQDAEKPKPSTEFKVGVVNLTVVYRQNARVRAINDDLEKNCDLCGKARKVCRRRLESRWFPLPTTEERSELARLRAEAEKLIDEKFADQKAAVKREVNDCIKAVAQTYGYKVVLAYGDTGIASRDVFSPFDWGKEPPAFGGGLAPLYVAPEADLTPIVVHNLKSWAQTSSEKSEPGKEAPK
jgi:Skp family chaperone for outer membrane proteins